jgi:hypothetical protein
LKQLVLRALPEERSHPGARRLFSLKRRCGGTGNSSFARFRSTCTPNTGCTSSPRTLR